MVPKRNTRRLQLGSYGSIFSQSEPLLLSDYARYVKPLEPVDIAIIRKSLSAFADPVFFHVRLSKREKKVWVLLNNKLNGAEAERLVILELKLAGYAVERTGKGHDYKVYQWAGFPRIKTFLHYLEVKSSERASLSRLQKQNQKTMGSKFRLARERPLFQYQI